MISTESPKRRIISAAVIYLVIYFLGSAADLWTTGLALTQSGVHEQNSFVTESQAYMAARAWTITLIGAAVMVGCVVFAVNYSNRVERQALLHPVASFKKIYVNPWSPSAIGVSPLHMLSTAGAFAALRILAAVNNLLIYFWGIAPIGGPIKFIAQRTSAPVGFCIVIVPLFYLLAIAVSPLAARVIWAWRTAASEPSLA